ncbi:hypothetical protein [Bifidobacterium thermophilum]|uniref:hypothetical protein n=1 Tax=Bifidobacterium thermophilum TaxID=33905 RepID=UPI0030D8ABBC
MQGGALSMGYVVVGICIVAAIVIVALLVFREKNAGYRHQQNESHPDGAVVVTKGIDESSSSDQNPSKPGILVEMLPVEAAPDDQLVEITDGEVLAHVNNLIPNFAQTGLATANAIQAANAGSEVLYRAIIPSGATLAKSKGTVGAVRGFYRGADGRIAGHADFVAEHAQNGAAAVANTASAAMSVASMVVGQYYMAQINGKIEKINNEISKVADFQKNEFKSRVASLIARVKRIADFQMETLEKDELRLPGIAQLDNLEKDCTELLGQANFTLAGYAKHHDLDYQAYEKELQEAQIWCTYQKMLLDMLYKISDLRFALHLGAVSREQCNAVLPMYAKQVEDTRKLLAEWHDAMAKRLQVDAEKARRKRSGFDGAVHFIPGLFNDDQNFEALDGKTVRMIKDQKANHAPERWDTSNLYAQDVQLISKNGKIYYLPPSKTE